MGISLVGLLAGIIVAATLIGVYMTQKHTEQMVSLVSNAVDGKKVQQTISINVQENMAAIFSSSGNYSTTVLYDYRRVRCRLQYIENMFLCFCIFTGFPFGLRQTSGCHPPRLTLTASHY